MRVFILSLAAAAILLLAACSGGTNQSGAPKAVEDYLQALVSQDTNLLSSLSCADWEEDALLELDSFQGVTAKLDNPACAETGTDGAAKLVTCQGKIVATYNNEDQELALNVRTYKVIEDGGAWQVCGYAP